jgi:hypothetical protein
MKIILCRHSVSSSAENTSDVEVTLFSADSEPAEIQAGGKLTLWNIRSFKREEKKAMPFPGISLIRQDG